MLAAQFTPSNNSHFKFWGSESLWWTAAISSILWIILFAKIISICQWTNQNLEISNNMTRLSNWHNQLSCTGLLEFSDCKSCLGTSFSCQHSPWCNSCHPPFHLMVVGGVSYPSKPQGIKSPTLFWYAASYQLFVLHSCLLPFSCQNLSLLVLSPNTMIQIFSNLPTTWIHHGSYSQTCSKDVARHLAPNINHL